MVAKASECCRTRRQGNSQVRKVERCGWSTVLLIVPFALIALVCTSQAQAAVGVTVTAPNGGEQWAAGSTHVISWTTDGTLNPGVDIQYSPDNGNTWYVAASGVANDGSYDWRVPIDFSAGALIKVLAYNGASVFYDVSDAVFSITAPPGSYPTSFQSLDGWMAVDADGIACGWTGSASDVATTGNSIMLSADSDPGQSGGEIFSDSDAHFGKMGARIRAATGNTVTGMFAMSKDCSAEDGTVHSVVFELFGDNADTVDCVLYTQEVVLCGATSTWKYLERIKMSDFLPGFSSTEDYHDYEVEWGTSQIEFFVDGVLVATITASESSSSLHGFFPTRPSKFRLTTWRRCYHEVWDPTDSWPVGGTSEVVGAYFTPVISPIVITVIPASADVFVGATQQFSATVTGTSNTAVTWSVDGGAVNGTISSVGLYTAPGTVPDPATVTVRATSAVDPTKNGTATVTVSVPASADWVQDGVAICTATGSQYYPQLISDGSGGAIITWEDVRSWSYHDIYAQRIDGTGHPLWTNNGVAISTATNHQSTPQIASDCFGGAIIVWEDHRGASWDIYAQRVDANGYVLWTGNGVPICTASGDQLSPEIISNGSGGAIIAWKDKRSGTSLDLYAQRIDANGAAVWAADGVVICTAVGDQDVLKLASDGSGGAIITWEDHRGASWDTYAQRVAANGYVLWTGNGVPICTASGDQLSPEIISGETHGAIVAWRDRRSYGSDIYVQRIDANGATAWTADGVAICTAVSDQDALKLASDGSGGAIITWQDFRGTRRDIYAQRIDVAGKRQWAVDGVAVCSAPEHQMYPRIASDGSGGAIIAWRDGRAGSSWGTYAQRVSSNGNAVWVSDGVPICTASGGQSEHQIASNNLGGAIITWQDNRGGGYDIYAMRVKSDGTTPVLLTSACARVERGCVDLSWQLVADVPSSSFVVNRSDKPELGFMTVDLPIVKDSRFSFSCIDCSVLPGRTYWYRIVLVGPSGTEESYGPIEVHIDAVPTAYAAYESYPNPFNPMCTIKYEIPSAGRVTLQVFDIVGKPVCTLVDAWREPGVYSEIWDGRADDGRALPSGVYFYRLEVGDFVATRKMVLIH